MIREEEIKARLDSHTVAYRHQLSGHSDAETDMLHLLARNEELQRRVEKMQAVVDKYKKLEDAVRTAMPHIGEVMAGIINPQPNSLAASDDEIAVCLFIYKGGEALNELDAKEQDDD